ncbi:MAG TPA: NAD(P)H-dependent oxidoreductase [Streptomyces sp.]|jgi:NAD(P)H-dependent FMN reductase|nr:NAD(P)H-dependent oxidoreductase [Streptomyces sp.]
MTATVSAPPAAPLRLAVIIGSVRGGRLGPTVARWAAAGAAERGDVTVDVVDLAETDLPMAMPSFGAPPWPETTAALEQLSPRLDAADAFVVVTPEYNHSYPAALKNAIDWHREEWQAKPVGFVSYGGISGGLRAVEHLRGVFAEMHAVTVRDTVSFHGAGSRFDAEGRPVDPEGCEAALKTMLDHLTWWAHALRDARARRPYGQ